MYERLIVLIPSHGLEDLPQELPEQDAEGLLNSFAVLWHPELLVASRRLPTWSRADDPPHPNRHDLFLVPGASAGWLPCSWVELAEEHGAHVVQDLSERNTLVARVLEPLGGVSRVDPETTADFLALGHCRLQLELLTRQMRYYGDLDTTRLEGSVIAAARAAVAGDQPAVERHLSACFEVLLEGRERFYPVDCYLADLCLVTADAADEHWSGLLQSSAPANFLMTASTLRELATAHPDDLTHLAARWRDGTVDVVGGEWDETCLPLVPLDVAVDCMGRGLRVFGERLGRRPLVWGRRRFGLGPQLPQLLRRHGYEGALHFVIDDGVYPDDERGKLRWEGADGSVIDAASRIPLAADSASAMLRFAQRMSESMDYDQAALVLIARWPEVRAPWLEDLQRIHRFAPVLGRMVTLSDFFRSTDSSGRLTKFQAGDYLSPQLVRSVAGREAAPLSRHLQRWQQHALLQAAEWSTTVAALAVGRPVPSETRDACARALAALADESPDLPLDLTAEIQSRAHRELGDVITRGRGTSAGCLLLNPLSFDRRAVIDWPAELPPPAEASCILSQQVDGERRALVMELPAGGFVWLPAATGPPATPTHTPAQPKRDVPMAETNLLRNDFFEVRLSDVSGGISQIRSYRRGANRLSQQLAVRFPRERTVTAVVEGESETYRTWYSEMRVTSSEVLCDGPTRGAIQTCGELVDPAGDEVVARYRQVVSVWRRRPVIDLEIEVDIPTPPERDPWTNYLAVRWAWNSPSAALTYSAAEGAHPVTSERLEAPLFLEIADGDQRTTILTGGLPCHRKTGPRMLDTPLIVAGELRRQFRFSIAVDDPYPLAAARDMLLPPVCVPLTTGPATLWSGWFFHLDARNVQITRVMPGNGSYAPGPGGGGSAAGAPVETPGPAASAERSVVVRLLETEGRPQTVRLSCFVRPSDARQIDFLGKTITELVIDRDDVLVEVTPYEICDIALAFPVPNE
jgi:alpha-mannosidase